MSNFSSQVQTQEGINPVKLIKDFKHIRGFSLLRLESQKEYNFESKDTEIGILILEGTCVLKVNDQVHSGLGERLNVFQGLPTGIYIPCDTRFSLKGQGAHVAMCYSKCTTKTEVEVLRPQNIKPVYPGKDNWSREVRMIIGPNSPAVNMILGETINPPGNWSGVPPAKHENQKPPLESKHEELYYFRTDKSQGWGIERLYSPERNVNEIMFLQENTVTFMPWGYHQIVSAPGYTLYYLFFLSGEGKQLAQCEDPEHNWIKKA